MELPKTSATPDDVDRVYLTQSIVAIDGLRPDLTIEQHTRVAAAGGKLAKKHFVAAMKAGLI